MPSDSCKLSLFQTRRIFWYRSTSRDTGRLLSAVCPIPVLFEGKWCRKCIAGDIGVLLTPKHVHLGAVQETATLVIHAELHESRRNAHMPLITWKPEYSVNIPALDSHHQKLFHILNTVYENVMTSPELDRILPKVDELLEFTSHHFSTEEQYMREQGFPDIDDHIAKHSAFTHTIDALRTRYNDNDLEVSRDLIILLGDWLLRHVLKEDRKYSEMSIGLME